MEKQIEASQRFLRGLRSLASFEEVRSRQYRHLRGVIEKAPLVSTACVADLVSSLDASVWEHAQIEELKALLADKLGEVGKERRAMQDYVCLPLYLDQSVWNMLQTTSEQGERFERLCRHAIALGMRCPSEYTIAALVWLAACAFRLQDLTDVEKQKMLRDWKPKLKRWLQGLQEPAAYLQVLPAVVENCPAALLAKAYPAGFVPYTPPGWSYEHYEQMVRRYPLRHRKNADTVPTATSEGRGFFEMGRLLAGFAEANAFGRQGSVASVSSHASIADDALPRVEVQPSAIAAVPQPKVAPPLLALEDAPVASVSHTVAPASAAQELEKLRAELPGREAQEASTAAMKRPAARRQASKAKPKKKATACQSGSAGSKPGSARSQKKADEMTGSAGSKPGSARSQKKAKKMKGSAGSKPEAASTKAVKTKALKRPAAATGMSEGSMSKSEIRERLLAKVPQKLKKAYKDGCHTCRWRPGCCNSCWIKRGFPM